MKSFGKCIQFAAVLAAFVSCLDTAQGQTNSFVITPSSLSLTTPVGSSALPSTLNVNTSGASVTFTVQTTGGSNCDLRYQGSTATPSQLTVFAETSALPVGTYSCGIVFSANGLNPVTVPVSITVNGSGSAGISVSPQSLTLSAQTGSAAITQSLTLTNSNLSVPVNYTASVTYPTVPPLSWLSVTPTTGTVPPNNTVQLQANPTGLPAGTYNGNIVITPAGSAAITVPVSLTISGNPTLVIQQGGSTVSSVNFVYQTGTSLPSPQTINFSSSNSNTPLAFSVAVNGGSNFLVVQPIGQLATPAGSGSTPVTLSIASTASSLPAGDYSASLTITSPGASNTTTTIPVNFKVSALPLLTASAPPAAFNYSVGGPAPASQTLQIGTSSTALGISVFSNVPAGQSWLSALPSAPTVSAASPATLTISVNPTGLAAGTYTGTVSIVANGAGNSPFNIPVTLNVTNSTMLNVAPSQLTYTYQTGGSFPAGQTINVSSSGGTLTFNAAAATAGCGTSWITLSQPGGSTGNGGTAIGVFVNPAGIPGPSICTGTVTITANGASNTLTIPVVLQVSSTPIVQLSQSGINLTGQLNSGNNTAVTTLTITSSDSVTPLTYTLSSPAPWLNVTPTSGTTPQNIQVSASTNGQLGLQLGVNTTTITLTSPSLQQAIVIPVTLTLTGNATIAVAPTTLTFTQPAGGQAPATQTVNVSLATGTGVGTYTATAAVNFGSWLSVSQVSQSIPGSFTVSVNGAGLSQGTYQGTVTVSAAGANNSPLVIPVTLTVTQAQSLALSLSTLNFNATVGQATAVPSQAIQVTSQGGAVTFTVGTATSTCPGFLNVTPNTGTTPATVTVGVNVAGLSAGTCSGTVTVSAPGLTSQSAAVTLTVAGLPAPALTQVVNGASFVPAAIAPGEIVTIFGTNLGPTTLAPYVLNPNNTFATKVADTEILFDGIAAPILFVRNDQVAVVVPFEVAGRFQTNIQVRRSGVLSGTIIQRVVDTAPGIFTVPSGGSGQGAIVNSNGVVNSSSAPAARGGAVSVYLTGAGQTNPAGISGALSGVSPLNIINADVTVTIGGVNAPVAYKGGAPGNIQGLYQLNVGIPANIGVGQQPIVVTIGGVATQAGVFVSVN